MRRIEGQGVGVEERGEVWKDEEQGLSREENDKRTGSRG